MSRTIMPIRLGEPVRSYRGVVRWAVNVSSSDASGCEPIVPAPGSDYELCVERLTVSICATVTVSIGEGEADGAVQKVLIGPLGGAVLESTRCFAPEPLVLTPNKALTFDASAAGIVTIWAEGFTRPATASESASSSPSSSASASASASPSASSS